MMWHILRISSLHHEDVTDMDRRLHRQQQPFVPVVVSCRGLLVSGGRSRPDASRVTRVSSSLDVRCVELFTARPVGTLSSLNGIRVLSMMGVVLGQ